MSTKPNAHWRYRNESRWPRHSLLATMVIYNSEVSRRVSGLRLLDRHGRTRVIHNGVRGPDRVSPARRTLDDPYRLVYVGRLSPRKGVDLILTAARQLTDHGLSTTVDLVGSVFPGYEWYEHQLRERVSALQLEQQVHFHGFQSTVWPYLAAADVAVVPSRLDESFGNVVVESLLAARPVVASDHTGLSEAARGFTAAVLTARDDAGQSGRWAEPSARQLGRLPVSCRAGRRYGSQPATVPTAFTPS